MLASEEHIADLHRLMGLRFGEALLPYAGKARSQHLLDAMLCSLHIAGKNLLYEGFISEKPEMGFKIEHDGIRVTCRYKPFFPFEVQTASWFYPYAKELT